MKKIKDKMVENEKGIAVVLVMIFMVLLTSLGIWLSMTSTIELKTTSALRGHEEAFNLGDGASQLSLRYLGKNSPPSPNWNPTVEGQITSNLPSYLNEKTFQGGKKKLHPKIFYKGYSTNPGAGWGTNKRGYSGFYKLKYTAEGIGELPAKGSKTTVDMLLWRISK